MFDFTLNLHVALKNTKGSVPTKIDVPVTDEQVDRNKESNPKTTFVDWWKLVGVLYYSLRFAWLIVTLINS